MKRITEITDSAIQTLNIVGENNERITLNLRYMPTQQGWYFNLSYEDFTVNGCRLVNHVNCLNSYKNLLPFGIFCTSANGLDPTFIDDFTTGRNSVYLLTNDDVDNIEVIVNEI